MISKIPFCEISFQLSLGQLFNIFSMSLQHASKHVMSKKTLYCTVGHETRKTGQKSV